MHMMMRRFHMGRAVLLALFLSQTVQAADFYVATNGSDNGAGTLAQPFASITQAQQAASAGDNVYIRGGTYTNFSVAATDATYQYVLDITKSNINYLAYPGDSRPVLNFSNVAPTTLRVCGIEVTGSNNTFQGIDVTGRAGRDAQAGRQLANLRQRQYAQSDGHPRRSGQWHLHFFARRQQPDFELRLVQSRRRQRNLGGKYRRIRLPFRGLGKCSARRPILGQQRRRLRHASTTRGGSVTFDH